MWNSTGGFGADFGDGGFGGSDAAAGGGGGGGFMNSPGGGQFNTPSGAKKERRSQNIMSCAIRSILENKEENFTIEDVDVNMVDIMGIVRSVEIGSTKVSYTIDDHTGIIDVLKYSDGDGDDNSQQDALAEGVYARVFGPVRSHQGKKHVIGFKVVQVEDPNLITSHLLEVIHQKLKLKQMKSNPQMGGGSVPALANSSLVASANAPSSGRGLGPEKDMVYAAIQSSTAETGMSRNMIKTVLKGKMSGDRIDKIVEELSSDGTIYTTHDDDHFQVIEA